MSWKFAKDPAQEKPHQTMKKFLVLPRRLISETAGLNRVFFQQNFCSETMCSRTLLLPSLNPI